MRTLSGQPGLPPSAFLCASRIWRDAITTLKIQRRCNDPVFELPYSIHIVDWWPPFTIFTLGSFYLPYSFFALVVSRSSYTVRSGIAQPLWIGYQV